MDRFDPSALQVVGGILTLVVLFVLREFASGALKKAGEEFWVWARHRQPGVQEARSEPHDSAGPGNHAAVGRRGSEQLDRRVAHDQSPCLLPLGRGAADSTAIRGPSVRRNALAESRRKSA